MKPRMYDKGRAGVKFEKKIKELSEGKSKTIDAFMEKFGFKKNLESRSYIFEIAPNSLGFKFNSFKICFSYGEAILTAKDPILLISKVAEKIALQTRDITKAGIEFDLCRLAKELTSGRFFLKLNKFITLE